MHKRFLMGMAMATLMVPGAKPASVSVEQTGKGMTIAVKGEGLNMKVQFTDKLNS